MIGPENNLTASLMNSAIVVFVKTVYFANQVVESGVVVNDIFTAVLPHFYSFVKSDSIQCATLYFK